MRMHGHAAHDDMRYVPPALVDHWRARDPITRQERRLRALGVDTDALRAGVDAEIERATAAALAMPEPDPATVRHGASLPPVGPSHSVSGGRRGAAMPSRRARRITGAVPGGCYETPMTVRVARRGTDLVVIAYGAMVGAALEATADLDGAAIEVLDLRALVPLDEAAILDSVARCAKVVVVEEANATCAAGAQVAALIAEHAFGDLDGPIRRVAAPDVPIPFAPGLERAVLPQGRDIREACRELLAY